jgi:hypothetical protein
LGQEIELGRNWLKRIRLQNFGWIQTKFERFQTKVLDILRNRKLVQNLNLMNLNSKFVIFSKWNFKF